MASIIVLTTSTLSSHKQHKMDLYTKDLNDDSDGSLHETTIKDAFHSHPENAMDQSFMTIQAHLDHNSDDHEPSSHTAAAAADVDDDNMGDAITPNSSYGDLMDDGRKREIETPSKAARNVTKPHNNRTTIYEHVTYHDTIGKLVLTSKCVTFQPVHNDNDNNNTDNNKHSSWRWKRIRTHKISTSRNSKTLLKLIRADDDSDHKKGVTFALRDRPELERIRQDISQRLRFVRNNRHPPQQPAAAVVVDTKDSANEKTALLSRDREPSKDRDENSSAATTGRSHKVVWAGCIVLLVALLVLKYYFHYLPVSTNNSCTTTTTTTTTTERPSGLPYTDDIYVVPQTPKETHHETGSDHSNRR